MKPRLAIILLSIILFPVGVLVVSGTRMAHSEQTRVRETLRQAQLARLAEVSDAVSRNIVAYESELLKTTDSVGLTVEPLRQVARSHRLVSQMFVLDPSGELIYPESDALKSTERERAFLSRTQSIWKKGQTFYRPAESKSRPAREYGWHTWFWEDGLNFIFWQRRDSGHIVGAELHKMALVADIIGSLPSSPTARQRWGGSRIMLRDSAGKVLYEWGDYEPAADEPPLSDIQLKEPLGAWRFQYYGDMRDLGASLGRSATFNVLSGVGVAVVAIMALGVLFYRESSREMREASQRVSFVNQVSHELKTPLTNIRMYAELLDARLDTADEKAKHQAQVVITECERLSRLIANVLAFAREQRNGLDLRPRAGTVDECVEEALLRFGPSLKAKGIQIETSLGASAPVLLDPDALAQVLGNLFSNVEKYAATGGFMSVSTEQHDGKTVIAIEDRGPGIPRNQRRRVFDPFVRLSNRLSDGVSGTGIGLGIARRLARLHGGDLVLEDCPRGARFVLRLKTDPA